MSQPAMPTGAWAVHRADIRTRIVDAFLDLIASVSPGAVSMPAVAGRAGISVRTLYRYFPSKDDLQRDAAGWLDRRAREAMGDRPIDLSSLQEYLRILWRELAAALPAVRVQHSTPEGRELRIARLAPSRTQVDEGLPAAIGGSRRAEVVDLIVAICSSSMFLELVDRMGHEPDDAARICADLVGLIVEHEAGRVAGDTGGIHDIDQ